MEWATDCGVTFCVGVGIHPPVGPLCPQGHPLVPFTGPDWACNVCGTQGQGDTGSMACRVCDYDLCGDCGVGRGTTHDPVVLLPDVARLVVSLPHTVCPTVRCLRIAVTMTQVVGPDGEATDVPCRLGPRSVLAVAVPRPPSGCAAGVLLLPLVWHRMWTGKLGGINGDVVGAAVQIRELWVWVCL